jgi:hypothetical protein
MMAHLIRAWRLRQIERTLRAHEDWQLLEAVRRVQSAEGRELRCRCFSESGGWTVYARGVVTGAVLIRGAEVRAVLRITYRDRGEAGAEEEVPVVFVEWEGGAL